MSVGKKLLAAAASTRPPREHVRKPAAADYSPTALTPPVPSPVADDVYHPDVIDFQTSHGIPAWNGYRYWMAFTPYPSEPDENPCIVASHDGDTWVVPTGLTNPIDPFPGMEYNSDTDLVYHNGLLYCTYRQGGAGRLRYRTSADGVNWSPEVVIGIIGSELTLSPAYVKVGPLWRMWYLESNGTLKHVAAPSIDGPWTAPRTCSVEMLPGFTAWHVDIIRHDGRYYGLVYAYDGTDPTNCVVGIVSDDGYTWGQTTDILMRPNDVFSQLYRATLQPAPGGFDVWVGGTRRVDGGHRLARTFVPAAEFE